MTKPDPFPDPGATAPGDVPVTVHAHLPRPGVDAEPTGQTLFIRRADRMALVLPEATISDVEGMPTLDELALAVPGGGGGPLAHPEDRRRAHVYGVGNVAWHLQRGLRYITSLLGRSLPLLTVRLQTHGPDWGGGHYRLPARQYSELGEPELVTPAGEVHLGAGRRYVATRNGRYFAAPSHNAAIIYHELGHHLCRHTADFRGNAHRDPCLQTNRRTAIEEGTCDYLAAVLLGTPDIYGWHRADRLEGDPRRRRLDTPVTMAAFRGGHDVDPHADGTVWATALWSARQAWEQCGHEGSAFDAALFRALSHLGEDALSSDPQERVGELRRRRYFSRTLEALLAQIQDTAGARAVEDAFAARGVVPGQSNAALRDAARR